MKIKELDKELKKFTGKVFCWDDIKSVLLKYGENATINTGYGVHLIQVHLDGREIIFDLDDDYIYDIYL